MKLLVTGAGGFLGRHVVACAARRGHAVRALVRPAAPAADGPSDAGAGVEVVRRDLRARQDLAGALAGVDAVVHLAAAKAGDVYDQIVGSVVTTENLLDAMTEAGVARLVLVSSFSVYDYQALAPFSLLDEGSPVERRPERRDPYTVAKLMQEDLVRRRTRRDALRTTVLRPGAIYGPGSLWTARLGVQLSPRVWLRISAWSPVPLTYVENCAEAIVLCAERESTAGETFNVVDVETPPVRRYVRALQRRSPARPRVLPVPWTAMRLLAGLAALADRWLFGGGAKIPQILRPAALSARSKPLRYSARRLESAVGWRPRFSLEEGLERSLAASGPTR